MENSTNKYDRIFSILLNMKPTFDDAKRAIACIISTLDESEPQLATVTAQRDKLLEALKNLVYGEQSGLFSIDVETCTEEIDYDNVHRASVVTTAKIWKNAHEAIKEAEGL